MPVDSKVSSRCLLVLGMHRSGTSAVTRCLNLVGMDVGSQLLKPDDGNAKGYWEHAEAVRINDALFAAFGMLWWSLDPLPESWLQTEAAEIARAEIKAFVRRDFSGVPLWGLKDPRMCRLAPLWIDVLRDMGIRVDAVFVNRHPLEVARSLARGHGLSEPVCVLSWMQHLAEAELATRGMSRSMIRYEQLLDAPLVALDRIAADLSLAWPMAPEDRRSALEAFLDRGMRTQRDDALVMPLPAQILDLDAACLRLTDQAKAIRDWSELTAACDSALQNLKLLAYRAGTAARKDDEQGSTASDPLVDFASLYSAAKDEDFSETRVVRRDLRMGRSQIELRLPAGAAEKYRLDPLNHAGYCIIHSLVLLDDQQRVFWDWQKGSEQLFMSGLQEVASPSLSGEMLHRMDEDPQIHFSLPEHLADREAVLRLDIEYFDASRLAREFDALQAEVVRQDLAHRAALGEVERARDKLSSELDSERSRSAVLMEHLEDAKLQLATLNEQANTAGQRLIDLMASIDGLRQALAHQQASLRVLLGRGLIERLRRRFLSTRFGLVPAKHLEAVNTAPDRWRVTGDDPIFLCSTDRLPLGSGWYMVSLNLQQHSGLPVEARLYPDYGSDTPPDLQGLALSFVQPGRIRHRGVVRFPRAVFGLRFDPADSPCEISVQGLSIRRVSKVRAAWALLHAVAFSRAIPGKPSGWRKIAQRLRGSGVREFRRWLYEEYLTPGQEHDSYDKWLRNYDAVTPEHVELARRQVADWKYKPLISVLVPVYNSPKKWLRRCIESVQAQAYPNWQLCLANDASTMPHVARILDEYAAADERIRVVHRPENGHISATSNSALALASGEYIALLDHDDELHPMALFEVAKLLQSQPSCKLIYTDEDKIDEQGRRYDPYMKPEWNYDLLLSQNYVCHFGVYERQLVQDAGGFREGFEGSQDWDLVLRCIERLKPAEIGHVPQVLYHWRAIPGSTAVGVGEKSYARSAGIRAIEEHLKRMGVSASVKEGVEGQGYLHIRYELPAPRPKVTLIIPTRDGLHLLKRCVDSILALTTYDNYEIVIVDNQSCEADTLAYFAQVVTDSRVRVLAYDQPFNYSALNNYAVRHTSGELVALVNNDIEVISPDWLEEMAGHAMRSGVGAVGAMLYYPNNQIQHAGVVLGVGGVANHAYCGRPRGYNGQMGRARIAQELSAVTAACLLIRRAVFEEVGGLNESLRVAFNDIDFCLRVRRAGYRNLWTPFAELYHHESATRGYEDSPEKQARFAGEVGQMLALWGDELTTDPAYSPNLSLTGAPFDLAFPPRNRS